VVRRDDRSTAIRCLTFSTSKTNTSWRRASRRTVDQTEPGGLLIILSFVPLPTRR